MDELYDLTPEDILLDKEAEEIEDASAELIQKPDSDLDLLDGMQDSDLDQIEDSEDVEDDTSIYDDKDDDATDCAVRMYDILSPVSSYPT